MPAAVSRSRLDPAVARRDVCSADGMCLSETWRAGDQMVAIWKMLDLFFPWHLTLASAFGLLND